MAQQGIQQFSAPGIVQQAQKVGTNNRAMRLQDLKSDQQETVNRGEDMSQAAREAKLFTTAFGSMLPSEDPNQLREEDIQTAYKGALSAVKNSGGDVQGMPEEFDPQVLQQATALAEMAGEGDDSVQSKFVTQDGNLGYLTRSGRTVETDIKVGGNVDLEQVGNRFFRFDPRSGRMVPVGDNGQPTQGGGQGQPGGQQQSAPQQPQQGGGQQPGPSAPQPGQTDTQGQQGARVDQNSQSLQQQLQEAQAEERRQEVQQARDEAEAKAEGKSDAEGKKQVPRIEAAASTFRSVLTDPQAPDAIGPEGMVKGTLGQFTGSEAGQLRTRAERELNRLVTQAMGTLKGEPSDRDVQYVVRQKPTLNQSPRVWLDWYNNSFIPRYRSKFQEDFGVEPDLKPIEPDEIPWMEQEGGGEQQQSGSRFEVIEVEE